MEIFFHILGLCPDAQAHFDIIDLLSVWDTCVFHFSRLYLFAEKIKVAAAVFLK